MRRSWPRQGRSRRPGRRISPPPHSPGLGPLLPPPPFFGRAGRGSCRRGGARDTHAPSQGLDLERRPARRRFLRRAAGAGLALAGTAPLAALAPAPRGASACHESVQDIIDTALVAEQLAT